MPRNLQRLLPLVLAATFVSGCAVIAVADAAVTVAATTVRVGAAVVETTVDVAAAGVDAVIDDEDDEKTDEDRAPRE